MTIVTNELDNPMKILGIEVSYFLMVIGSIVFGAAFETFWLGMILLGALFVLKRYLAKFASWHFQRVAYRLLPTKVIGKSFSALAESYKTEWCK